MQRNRGISLKLQAFLALWLSVTMGIGSAASPMIGMAIAKGTFALDESKVSGNGTLFEGSVLQTGAASSEVRLNNGVRMLLDGSSRTKIYRDRMTLERGTGQVEGNAAYRIDAAGLQVTSPKGSVAKVAMRLDKRLLVAALNGPVTVRTASGLLVANLGSGHALEFDTQDAGAAAPVEMQGKLEKRDGRFFLTDSNTGVTVEVKGDNLDRHVGAVIKLMGVVDPVAKAAAGASSVVNASSISTVSAAANAAAVGTGMSVATKTVIAGVVIAGAATGSAVALTSDEKPPISN